MSLLPIVKVGAPTFARRQKPITRFDKKLEKTLKAMAESMYANNGCGLAAPQIAFPSV